jgi:hypothetical protein
MNILNALMAPFEAIWREVRGVMASPLAFFGGLGGMVIMCSALAAFFMLGGGEEQEEDEDLWDMEFQPGALVQIGKEIPEDELVITEETVARDEPVEEVPEEEVVEEEEAVQEEVTKDDKPIEKKKEPTEKKPKKITPKKPKEKPEDKPKDTKKADHNTKKNNPYDDLPTHDQNRGDPFGDPGGWAEIAKDGDAWATAVMKALNNLSPPGWAGNLPNGTYKFRVKFCKNGTVSKVYDKGGSAPGDFKAAVRKEVERIKVPPIPSKHAKSMKGSCQTLPHVFTYKAGKTK